MSSKVMDLYEDDARQKAEDFVSRVYGKGHPEFADMVEKQTKLKGMSSGRSGRTSMRPPSSKRC